MTITIIFYKQRFINMPKNSNIANTRTMHYFVSKNKTEIIIINNKTELA